MKELQPWELTPEEIGKMELRFFEGEVKDLSRAIANAAVKKLVEWIGEVGTDDGIAWCIFNTDWAELRREVGL